MDTTNVKEELKTLYRDARDGHSQIANLLSVVDAVGRAQDPSFIVDAVYALKQANAYIDETRKAVNRTLEELQKTGCVVAVKSGTITLEGDWASGRIVTSQQPYLPHPDREFEQYSALMSALGVPQDLIDSKTMHPRWEAVGSVIAKLGEEGKPVPPALKSAKMIMKYTVSARARKTGGMDTIIEHDGQGVPDPTVVPDDNPF